jgi:putative heme-binding domain-containing protein
MKWLIICIFALANLLRADDRPADAPDDTLPALVQMLSESDDAQFQLDILKGMSEALKGRTGVKMPAGWDKAKDKLVKSANPEVKALAQSLSTMFGDTSQTEVFRKIALDASAPAADREKALQALLDAKPKDLAPTLQELIADPRLRALAMQGLAAYEDPKTPDAILQQYQFFNDKEKLDALNTLASRDSYAKVLLAHLTDGSIPRKDVSAATVRQLSELKDPEIDAWIKANWGAVQASSEEKLKDMARIKAVVLAAKPAEINLSHGRAVFVKTCSVCHTLYGEGGHVGPDLTGSGRADIDYLMMNVVDPSAVVGKDYQVWMIRTKKKRLISGIITREDDQTLTVVSENETITLQKSDIDRMKQSEVSMMPEGLLQGLPHQDLIDLIAYLRSSTQVPLPATMPSGSPAGQSPAPKSPPGLPSPK